MTTDFTERGKIFTNVIAKRPVPVVIHTQANRILGTVHVTPSERVKDELNHSEMFVAVTDAIIYDLQGREICRCNFLTLNREHISWLIPEDELIQMDDSGGQV